ncbi:uncharacterized protein VICG_00321 [Vittaforma corneae ATCC 50505]|uniref:Mechanosensitive ion channel MscS domain-containing protein n=1 Tax=Vittaforma corneae (strain ATCC 50505) TaxID=993615 RepID=L2GPN8_VITCO|nr:uncharacterized protein VICG_00321 [Vittaforma corneae ATCC 50505]ELA42569.1 hypothetical protein VICG_00321 [Vittaforma corneae ATCC 50505]
MNIKISEERYLTDDESTSFIESESETIDKQDEYIEKYDFRHKLFDALCSFRIILPVLGLILIMLSYFLWNVPVEGTKDTYKEIHFGSVFFACGCSLIVSITLGTVFESISMNYLKKSRGDASYCYYFNELSFHISGLLVMATIQAFLMRKYEDFYLVDLLGIKLYLLYSLRLMMFASIILGLLKAAVKYVSMRFNYNMYINSIRKCILFDFFVSLISTVKEDEDSERIARISIEKEPESILKDFLGTTSTPLNTFILQKRFRVEDASQLSFGEKRLLIKEFLNLEDRNKMYSGSLPVVLGKIKDKAESRANKLVRKLRRQDKVKKAGDISKFFSDQGVFKFLLSQLKIKPEEPIEKDNIAHVIEKTYKDKYVIKKNLEQINSAIQRVSFVTKLVIYIATAVFMFISASIQIDYLSAILSGIFGTQFISKILSDGVLQSIIFLFVIHPFDIGDRVFIRLGDTVENLVVAELNIFSTTFYKFDGTSFFVPNSVMIGTHISNIRRSKNIMESHSIQIDSNTKPKKLVKLREMLVEFCRHNTPFYTDYILVNYESIENSNKLYIKILMQYKGNFQNYEYYLKRRSEFVCELGRCLKHLKIGYSLPTQKVRIVQEE